MNVEYRQQILQYALVLIAILCILYILSLFGISDLYPHIIGKNHPHKWHTLFRLCLVIAFAIANHRFFVPQLYMKKRYLLFFAILLLCMAIIWVLPDLILPQPKFEPQLFARNNARPPGLRVLLFELAHIYLFFFLSTFTSIANRTQEYIQKIEAQYAAQISSIEQKAEATLQEKLEERTELPVETAVTVTINYSLVRIEYSDILFIKSMDNYLQFHLKEKKPILVRMTLKELTEKLPQEQFLRVHKSYIVAIPTIDSIRNKIILIHSHEIPIGRAYEDAISKALRK